MLVFCFRYLLAGLFGGCDVVGVFVAVIDLFGYLVCFGGFGVVRLDVF